MGKNKLVSKIKKILKLPFHFARKVKQILLRFNHNTINIIKWILYDKYYFNDLLKRELELKKLKPFKISAWHDSYSYYTAINNGCLLYIKRGHKFNSVERESTAIKLIDEKYNFFFPKVLTSNINNEKNNYIVYKYINEPNLKEVINFKLLDIKQKSMIIQQLYIILTILNEIKVIHMDIHPENIFINIKNDVRITLIDFGFSIILNDKKLCSIADEKSKNDLKTLGAGYNPENFFYDDAYSILMIMKEINPNLKRDEYDIWKKVNSLIGELSYELI